ncbi:MAG: hypothetical protein PVJ15_06325 [Gammaproteobacteria bacterium]|jgi:hypothetical protein
MITTRTGAISAALFTCCLAALQSSAVFAQPGVWEAQTGATLPGQALDNVNDGTTLNLIKFNSMSFPFAGTVYTGNDTLNISSNGFLSLGGSNGDGCVNLDCSGDPQQLLGFPNPTIAPLWTDLNPDGMDDGGGDIYINRFNDDGDPAIDRIVITFATGFADCANNACSTLTQVQLLEDGTIIFGYNGVNQTAAQTADILIGLSPGNGVADPGNTDYSMDVPFDSGMEPTIYQLFSPPQDFNLDDTNLVFTPNGMGGFNVDDTLPDPPPSSEPPTWESALGATIRGGGLGLDDVDDDTITRTFGSMSFPFAGSPDSPYTGAETFSVSSNGFISLGGDNGTGCLGIDCSGDPQQLLGFPNPTIAPLWTDLEPGPGGGGDIYFNAFNDDGIAGNDRIVITFATGFHDCVDAECSALAQVQLLGAGNKYFKDPGTIIFGYNRIVQTDSQTSNILVGVSPGNSAADPGSTNLNAKSSFNTSAESTVYQLFAAGLSNSGPIPPPFDLDGGNVVFEPNGLGGFVVSTPGTGAAGVGGGGGGGGGGGCVLRGGTPPDPWFPALLSGLALLHLLRRRHRSGLQHTITE